MISMSPAGYCRVSTEEQAREGVSMDVQEAKIRDYCKLNDLGDPIIFRDSGESGKNLHRPAIQELIKKIEDREISAIVVWKLDRICRNTLDMLGLIKKFDKYGSAFHSITEKVDTSTAMGTFFVTILSALAQMEREMIVERTKAALGYKRSRGERVGQVPYGFRGSGKDLITDDNEQEVLKEILRVRDKGWGYTRIATQLNKNGIPTRCGGRWYPETVKSVIQHNMGLV